MVADWSFKKGKMTTENYHVCRFNMKMYLIVKNLWEIVTGAEAVSNRASVNQKKALK